MLAELFLTIIMAILIVYTHRVDHLLLMLEYVLQDKFVKAMKFFEKKICQMHIVKLKIELLILKTISYLEIFAMRQMAILVELDLVNMEFASHFNNKVQIVVEMKNVELDYGVVSNQKLVDQLSLQEALVPQLVNNFPLNVDSLDNVLTQNAFYYSRFHMEWIPEFQLIKI